MKLPKFLMILVIVILFAFATNPAIASNEIIFSDINKVTTDLQMCKIIEEENIILKENKLLLSSEVVNIEQTNKILIEQNKISIQRIQLLENYSEVQTTVLNNFEQLFGVQQDMYEQVIESVRPSFLEKVKEGMMMLGTGIVIGILLI